MVVTCYLSSSTQLYVLSQHNHHALTLAHQGQAELDVSNQAACT